MESLPLVKMRDCEISVIIPAYQAAEYLGSAIESVINQTFDKFEVIVVDDGSTDGTDSLIKDYKVKDSRVVSVTIPNSGMAAARKKGLSLARAEWIAFLDADDMWLPTKLERQIDLIRSTNADVIISSGYYFGEVERLWKVESYNKNGKELLQGFVKKNTTPLLSTLIKKNKIEEVGGFSLPRYYDIVADYDLWLRLCYHNCRFVSAGDDFLFKYRIHGKQSTYISKRLETCCVVADLLKLYYNDHYIPERLFHSGVVSHFRELIDFEFANDNKQNVGIALQELTKYVDIGIAVNWIKWFSKTNKRLAQIASWRMLGRYI